MQLQADLRVDEAERCLKTFFPPSYSTWVHTSARQLFRVIMSEHELFSNNEVYLNWNLWLNTLHEEMVRTDAASNYPMDDYWNGQSRDPSYDTEKTG